MTRRAGREQTNLCHGPVILEADDLRLPKDLAFALSPLPASIQLSKNCAPSPGGRESHAARLTCIETGPAHFNNSIIPYSKVLVNHC